MYSSRTDLAVEEILGKSELTGIKSEEMDVSGLKITRVTVEKEGEKIINKPAGSYITIEINDISQSAEHFENAINIISTELKKILNFSPSDTVLIAGLGNKHITPDALGPQTIDSVMITRHLKEYAPDFFDVSRLRQVASITPGVLGQTGIETSEVIKAIVEKINPAAVIVIDALASRKMQRLATTIQITDSGIVPGGGVDNARAHISKDALGVPVISVGVPTVVDAATLTTDVIEEVLKTVDKQSKEVKLFKSFSSDETYYLIKEALSPYDLNLIVTPKDIDFIIGEISKALGFSINKALHGDISITDMEAFLA